uniref:Secreted protein n=1 Tax=Arundo donax TaxID=35708 RepID=A0A0A9EBT2_ARUDO
MLQHGVPVVVGTGVLRGCSCWCLQLLAVRVVVVVSCFGGERREDEQRVPLRWTHGQASREEEGGSMDRG